ncbi:MAG: 50S ribosomal protein L37e [Thermoplasmatota archaeon]
MSKGTSSKGKKSKGTTHIKCRRCGKKSYHVRKKFCAACGFGKSSKMKEYNWAKEH